MQLQNLEMTSEEVPSRIAGSLLQHITGKDISYTLTESRTQRTGTNLVHWQIKSATPGRRKIVDLFWKFVGILPSCTPQH
jgi:hypothetical protein